MAHHVAPAEELYAAILLLETPTEVHDFLADLCTPTEVAAFADRLHAARLLEKGITQRDVAAQTGIALGTVTRVARFLTGAGGGYRLILDRQKHAAKQK